MINRRFMLNGAAILLIALLVGCTDDVVNEAINLPEVNDDNCQQENIMKITDKTARSKFVSLCIRRGDLVKSTPKSW